MSSVATDLDVLTGGFRRIQSASAVGGSATISLSLATAPVQGNFLLVAVASRGDNIASIVQAGGSNWQLLDGFSDTTRRVESWGTQVPVAGFGQNITINMSGTDPVVGFVIEYEGVLKDAALGVIDDESWAQGSRNIATGGTTTAATMTPELFFGITLCTNGSVAHTVVTDGYTEIDQLSSGPGDTHLTASIHDRFPNSIGEQATFEVTLSASTPYIAMRQQIFGDLSATQSKEVGLDIVIGDDFYLSSDLDLAVAEPRIALSFLDMYIDPTREREVDLDVWIVPGTNQLVRIAVMNLWIAETLQQTTDLEVYVVGETRRETALDVLVSGNADIRIPLALDVAIIEAAPVLNIITTPESSRYIECRPLWCNVPKQTSRLVLMNMFIQEGTGQQVGVGLNMIIDNVSPDAVSDKVTILDLVIVELIYAP